MKALVCAEYGPVDGLVLAERPRPVPARGEVLIATRAAGLNFPDLLIVQGKYQVKPPLPFVPGIEGAGVVSAVGEGVTTLAVGDEVFAAFAAGTFAEYFLATEQNVCRKGATLSFAQAAGLPTIYGTAYYALKQRAALQPGETVLVLGAAGGVGVAAVQVARAMGARVIAAASNEDKLDFAVDAGADMRVNYAREDLKEAVKAFTDGKGVDVVFDPVGGALAEPAFRATAWGGRFLVIGFASGEIPKMPLNLAILKGTALVGVFWGSWVSMFPSESAENFRELLEMIERGAFTPRVTEVFPLARYAEAFRTLGERRAKGKVVLTVG